MADPRLPCRWVGFRSITKRQCTGFPEGGEGRKALGGRTLSPCNRHNHASRSSRGDNHPKRRVQPRTAPNATVSSQGIDFLALERSKRARSARVTAVLPRRNRVESKASFCSRFFFASSLDKTAPRPPLLTIILLFHFSPTTFVPTTRPPNDDTYHSNKSIHLSAKLANNTGPQHDTPP